MYAKVSNTNVVIEYPTNPIEGDESYVVVNESPQPQANIGWVVQENTPVKEGNSWYQSWTSILASKPQLKSEIANKRYQVETCGISFNNTHFSTDRDSQTKYIGALLSVRQESNPSDVLITWKLSDGSFIPLLGSDIIDLAVTVRNHVQNCYEKEAEYITLIDTANTSVLESTDFGSGWPSNY